MEEAIRFKAEGMMCQGCERVIHKQALATEGVKSCEVDYATQEGKVTFDDEKTDINKILGKIEEKGYKCSVIEEKKPEEVREAAVEEVKDKEEIEEVSFEIKGMKCPGCEEIIKDQALATGSVKSCEVDYKTKSGKIVFDSNKTDLERIFDKIEEKGYKCYINDESGFNDEWIGWTIGVVGLLIAGYFFLKLIGGIELPSISQNMSYGLLFAVGLLTGFHCVSMCGGFVVSYTAKYAQDGKSSYKAHLMYGLGKVTSYTMIGAAFGLLGSIITFTPFMRGVAGVLAGMFLVIFGLNMLNVIPALRKIRLRAPGFLAKFVGEESEKHSSPLMIGLLNGLMIACGPLQAIYIMAAGTGSLVEGAKLLFIFALGTLPVMLSFGYLTSFISSNLTHKILKASGVIVIVLGLIMLNNGLSLTGTGYDFKSFLTSAEAGAVAGGTVSQAVVVKEGYQEIRMDVLASGWSPNKFVLKKGVPVRWVINGKQITGCNNAIQVPKLGLNFDIKKGEQVIEFTPTEEGVIPWSCWMGMLKGTFIVKEDVDLNNQQEIKKELDSVQVPKGGSCGGGSGGGCGCG
ncbi:MAG: sulfite exporter TauE/SafE family protein [Nanoarchaeota archaeon]|nr:sulfite exporter TauE/SafE family protein [Nanoarchaeota archaeon]